MRYNTYKVFSTINNERWFEDWICGNWDVMEDGFLTFQIADPEESSDENEKRFFTEAIAAGCKIGEYVKVTYEQ